MTTPLHKLEGCLHKERRVYFKRVMGYFKKMGELFMVACSDVFGFFLPLCVVVYLGMTRDGNDVM